MTIADDTVGGRGGCLGLVITAPRTMAAESSDPAGREDPHALLVAHGEEPEPVVFDLISPLPPGRHRAADGRQAGLDE
jgi:hypothetical protein